MGEMGLRLDSKDRGQWVPPVRDWDEVYKVKRVLAHFGISIYTYTRTGVCPLCSLLRHTEPTSVPEESADEEDEDD